VTARQSDWDEVTLGAVSHTIRNGIFARRPNDDGAGERILRISAVRDGRVDAAESRFVAGLTTSQLERFALSPGDILLTRYNGSRHLVGISGLVSAHEGTLLHPDKLIRVIVNRRAADSRFLNYQLQSSAVRNFLEPRIRTTAGQSGIAGTDVRNIPLTLPPLKEQRRIVDILEDHLSRLDAADAGLAAARQRSFALLQSSLWSSTHGVGDRVPLTDVAEVRLGRQRSPSNHFGDRMVPYLRAANVDWDHFRLDDVKSMNFTAVEEQAYALREGDILLTEASGSASEVGKSAVYRGEVAVVCFQNTLLRVRCHGANPNFIQKYLLAEAYAGRFVAESRGVGIHHLGRSRLASWTVELPDEQGQESAAAMADEALVFIRRLGTQIDQSVTRGRALRRALLASAFSGKLTGRHTEIDVIQELAGV